MPSNQPYIMLLLQRVSFIIAPLPGESDLKLWRGTGPEGLDD